MEASDTRTLLPALQATVEKIRTQFSNISDERKALLKTLTAFISEQSTHGRPVNLNFICTHNSRRSHIAQLWAQAAAHYYAVPDVHAFSGGTEATALNLSAAKALQEAGFEIVKTADGNNPRYTAEFSKDAPPVTLFSKTHDDVINPKRDFAAVMTCSHADENCPVIPGASIRVSITYDDPKAFDGTPLEADKYRERVMEIGREMLYAFSAVRSNQKRKRT